MTTPDELPLILGGHSFIQQLGNDSIPDPGDADFRAHVADLMLRYSLFSPEVDRLIVAMRKPEWVTPNAESARRGPLSDEERVWLLERVAEDGAEPGVDELGRSTE